MNVIRVALLEDDADTREIISGWLRRTADIQASWHHGEPNAALRSLEESPPDVMLVDINLPIMSGVEFVRRAKVTRPDTQFIMLTV